VALGRGSTVVSAQSDGLLKPDALRGWKRKLSDTGVGGVGGGEGEGPCDRVAPAKAAMEAAEKGASEHHIA